ncbi:hypothetical protein GCM10027047_29860 [Rhodococcus aerolatus]
MSTAAADRVAYWDTRAADTGAHAYDAQPGQHPARAAWHAVLAAALPADPPLDVLDVGCGTGFLALELAALGHRVRGVDSSTGMLAVAARTAAERGLHVTWSRGDATAPPGPAVDLLCARNVLWTLPDPAAALHAWAHRLRPGGSLLLSDARWSAEDAADPVATDRFARSYTRAGLPFPDGMAGPELRAALAAAGLVVTDDLTGAFGATPYPGASGFALLRASSAGAQAATAPSHSSPAAGTATAQGARST